MLCIPEYFAAHTIAHAGDAGRLWIERLPSIVESLCQKWRLAVDGPPMHGGMGLALPVRRGDELCVLKVGWIDESSAQEALALSAWNGEGAVRLIEAQPELGALLLERLDSCRSLNEIGLEEAVAVAGQLLRRLAIAAPAGVPLLKETAVHLSETLPERWERSGRPMSRRLLDHACDLAAHLGPSAGSLLVNYDLHYADVLASEREPWLVIDPKVVVGDLEYGIAQLLWHRLEDMESQGGLARHVVALTEAAGLDPELTRSWTVVRCVDYWLWGVSIGLTEDPARCEAITHSLS